MKQDHSGFLPRELSVQIVPDPLDAPVSKWLCVVTVYHQRRVRFPSGAPSLEALQVNCARPAAVLVLAPVILQRAGQLQERGQLLSLPPWKVIRLRSLARLLSGARAQRLVRLQCLPLLSRFLAFAPFV